MKCCSKCQRLYEAEAGFCPIDGRELRSIDDVEVPSDPDDRRIGQKFVGGRYEIRRKVADGGMGRVYQALDLEDDCGVALKILHREVAVDAVSVERFKREYALSAELPHDHIVEVRAFQETEDDSYALVMEYLEGEELREHLKRQASMPPARLLRILSQLAIGLTQPHKMKFVHRDIKPDNVFLCHTPDGPVVKLLDFGSVRDNTEGAKKLTVIGTTIGSPFYMSPEQAQGLAELDHRADVWSLAAIAYECLTGKLPFAGKTGPQILLAILGAEPEPPSIAGAALGVPATVDDVMADALAKEASTRIGTVAELADRMGQAYGLEGSHLDWAYMPEMQLDELVEQCTERMASAELSSGRNSSLPPPRRDDFVDDDFVMGVPSGPPVGLYVGLGVSVLLGVAIALVALLW